MRPRDSRPAVRPVLTIRRLFAPPSGRPTPVPRRGKRPRTPDAGKGKNVLSKDKAKRSVTRNRERAGPPPAGGGDENDAGDTERVFRIPRAFDERAPARKVVSR